ncbi:hypothetical protein K456DRAFT_31481 [Colletotrichum gloeosporioides 23]|nr:hypothetical protein K456DRAFT_31481 [Colletotrichum gloeosporioides 23]
MPIVPVDDRLQGTSQVFSVRRTVKGAASRGTAHEASLGAKAHGTPTSGVGALNLVAQWKAIFPPASALRRVAPRRCLSADDADIQAIRRRQQAAHATEPGIFTLLRRSGSRIPFPIPVPFSTCSTSGLLFGTMLAAESLTSSALPHAPYFAIHSASSRASNRLLALLTASLHHLRLTVEACSRLVRAGVRGLSFLASPIPHVSRSSSSRLADLCNCSSTTRTDNRCSMSPAAISVDAR